MANSEKFELWSNLNWIFSVVSRIYKFLWMWFIDPLLVNILLKFEEDSNKTGFLVNFLLFKDSDSSEQSQHATSLIMQLLKNCPSILQVSTTNQIAAGLMMSWSSYMEDSKWNNLRANHALPALLTSLQKYQSLLWQYDKYHVWFIIIFLNVNKGIKRGTQPFWKNCSKYFPIYFWLID